MSGNLLTDIGSIWAKYGSVYLDGIANTLILATVATLIGCIIGFFCGILQTIPYNSNDFIVKRFILKLVRIIIRAYVEIFRGTPMILQAVFIYYGLPYFFKVNFTDIWVVSILVVSINTGAYMAESVRGGIMSIDKGQFEGAKAIGMNHWQTMLYIVLPQTVRRLIPLSMNLITRMIKTTSLVLMIGVVEVLKVSQQIIEANRMSSPNAAFGVYLTVFALYFFACWPISLLAGFLEKRWR